MGLNDGSSAYSILLSGLLKGQILKVVYTWQISVDLYLDGINHTYDLCILRKQLIGIVSF